MNDNFNQKGLIEIALEYKSLKNKELIPSEAISNRIIPTKASEIPIEQRNTYFQVAYVLK